jgi:hypothetical protein
MIMKKNAILIAGIMFVSGCASNYSQRAQYDATHDTSATVSSSYAYSDDISADSSKRGGSLDARGYDQDANNDDIEGTPDPLNPGRKADSSLRGGSIFARERELNHDAEPSSGVRESDRHMKADSSIRGGSVEARGAREARGDYESDVNVHSDFQSGYSHETRADFGQGSSAPWESDKASGSVRGSANWNASDDLMRDGLDSDADATTTTFEFDDSDVEMNNDASVGGAASAEVGEASSSISLEEKHSEEAASGTPNLNASEKLEENISGEYEIEAESALERDQSDNGSDTLSSSTTSASTTDIHHDEADLNAIESAGAAASAEVGSSSSSEEFESNDPAMNRAGSPLGTAGGEPNFLYRDNRAHGVGSATSGEFANAPVNQGAVVSDDQLAQRVKARLTSESTGTHGLMSSEVARNVQVSAENGEITLTGTVPSEKHKDLIEIRAREMSGVREVNNELTVTPEADAAHRDLSRGSDLEDVTNELQD